MCGSLVRRRRHSSRFLITWRAGASRGLATADWSFPAELRVCACVRVRVCPADSVPLSLLTRDTHRFF